MGVFACVQRARAVAGLAGPAALTALALVTCMPSARGADFYESERYRERPYEYSVPLYPRPYVDYARPREYIIVPAPRTGERVYEREIDRYGAPGYPSTYGNRYDGAPAYGANGYDDRSYGQGYRDGYADGRYGSGSRREFDGDTPVPPAPIGPRRGPVAYAPPYFWQ